MSADPIQEFFLKSIKSTSHCKDGSPYFIIPILKGKVTSNKKGNRNLPLPDNDEVKLNLMIDAVN